MNKGQLNHMSLDQIEEIMLNPDTSDEDRDLAVVAYQKKIRTLEIVKQYELANMRDDRGYAKKIGGRK
jgi:hypothetical protein